MNFPNEKSAVRPPLGTWAYWQIMLNPYPAFLNCETEYYIFLPKIRASLAHNRSQVKPIRQIHQVQIQATAKGMKPVLIAWSRQGKQLWPGAGDSLTAFVKMDI